ncbi:MAG: DUF6797 domain-containing protein, partial [Verrucomicrobiota bacterium]
MQSTFRQLVSWPGFSIHLHRMLLFAVCTLSGVALLQAEVNEPISNKTERKKWVAQGVLDQDFPFQNACISAPFPANNIAHKGIALKIGHDAYVCFDTDLLRMSAGWTGKYLNFNGVAFDDAHGTHPSIAGEQKFGTKVLPGFSDENGVFADPRPAPFGPVPEKLARWNGLYVQDDSVIFSYTVNDTDILEMPASISADGEVGFVRNFKIERVKKTFSLALCDVENATGVATKESVAISKLQAGDGNLTIATLVNAPKGVELVVENSALHSSIRLKLPKGTSSAQFKVVLWSGQASDKSKIASLLAGKPADISPKHTGKLRWPEVVTTKGVLNFDVTPDGAYAVDQLTPPTANPWKRRVRFSGMDFFKDGTRAALCTWDGDVWIVSGIDGQLENLKWKRFASGSYETLGLKIVDEMIYTSGRDQITRYHDFDGDGEADFYENFNNQVLSSTGFHEFVFDLQTDSKGNFYMAKAGPVRGGGRGFGGDNFGTITEHAGTLLQVSKDGRKLDVFATGFRAPNGFSVGPNDEITTSDNEGTWVPATPLNWVEKGGFYGVETLAHRKAIPEFHQPVLWMSHNDVDNSGGAQVWVTSKKWGPFAGDLLHLSYGKSMLYHVLMEKTSSGTRQGGVVKIPLKFTSSAMRGRFNPKDGQLYIVGLQGWQTTAAKLTGFDRVRYTGKPVYAAGGLKVKHQAIEISFTQPLDAASATDLENYSIKRWNYQRAENYGSPEFSFADPKKTGRDDLP